MRLVRQHVLSSRVPRDERRIVERSQERDLAPGFFVGESDARLAFCVNEAWVERRGRPHAEAVVREHVLERREPFRGRPHVSRKAPGAGAGGKSGLFRASRVTSRDPGAFEHLSLVAAL